MTGKGGFLRMRQHCLPFTPTGSDFRLALKRAAALPCFSHLSHGWGKRHDKGMRKEGLCDSQFKNTVHHGEEVMAG